jgi:hypothetical protein
VEGVLHIGRRVGLSPLLTSHPRHRLNEAREKGIPWKKWGPYLSERQWGTVREDYSKDGNAWNYFSHDQSRSRAYRWGEDGLAGISDDKQQCRRAPDSQIRAGLPPSERQDSVKVPHEIIELHAPVKKRADHGDLRIQCDRRSDLAARKSWNSRMSPREISLRYFFEEK